MNTIGIMQGRLSKPIDDHIQAFPLDTWREEFSLAKEAKLHCIEWIYEADTEKTNPLRTDEGILEIDRLTECSGVPVWSVCADYYITNRLVSKLGNPNLDQIEHLKWLIKRVYLLNARHIVLPFVDTSALKSPKEVKGLINVLMSVLPDVEQTGIELHLETDLGPTDLVTILKQMAHPLIRVNYDTGNSAALGFDPTEELTLLKPWLGSIHIKDRIGDGGSVPLGTGSTDFQTCCQIIQAIGSHQFFILQAARENGLNEVDLAIHNRKFIEGKFSEIAAGVVQ